MKIIPEPILFEWDEGNKTKNATKHDVNYKESEEVFGNRPLIVAKDVMHSQKEKRYYALGRTNSNRMLFLCFTIRGEKVRVISARDMNRKERKIYEKK